MCDVSGKKFALYSGSSLTQWNIWGLDNVGKINADTTRNYYLKDHLGSVRVVLNSTNGVISAQDYDAWGYQLENRSYNSSAMKYDFTGKERDNETSYDYFGARYYDCRIGRWGQVEPLLDKYPGATPYCYSLDNPIAFIDCNGLDLYLKGSNAENVYDWLSANVSFEITMDTKTGKLSTNKKSEFGLEDIGELYLFKAITEGDLSIYLNAPEENDPIFLDNNSTFWVAGLFGGTDKNGITNQYISWEDISKLNSLQISTVYESIIHEIVEAYIGKKENMSWPEVHKEAVNRLTEGKGENYYNWKVNVYVEGEKTRYVVGGIIYKNQFIPFYQYDTQKGKESARY